MVWSIENSMIWYACARKSGCESLLPAYNKKYAGVYYVSIFDGRFKVWSLIP